MLLCPHSLGDDSLQAEPQHKLPALYLLDSIVKNAKGPFITAFARNLPEVAYFLSLLNPGSPNHSEWLYPGAFLLLWTFPAIPLPLPWNS